MNGGGGLWYEGGCDKKRRTEQRDGEEKNTYEAHGALAKLGALHTDSEIKISRKLKRKLETFAIGIQLQHEMHEDQG